jgi:hypothetical protein
MTAALSIPRLLTLASTGPIELAISTAALIALTFVRSHGLPIIGIFLFIGLLLLQSRKLGLSVIRKRIIWLSLSSCVAIPLILTVNGHFQPFTFDNRLTLRALATVGFILPFLGLILGRVSGSPAPAIAAICVGALLWSRAADPIKKPADLSFAGDFLDVQLWARNHTKPGSVFMVEPTMSYGWRQYSQRPSFGTMREWLYAGWIYQSDLAILTEGLRRTALLGVSKEDLQNYAWTMARRPAYSDLTTKLRSAYNNLDGKTLGQLGRENGIAYFVFNRKFRTDVSRLDIVYENKSFAVVRSAR